MKYLLLIYMPETAITEAERQSCYKESAQLAHDLKANGNFISANPLQSVATATSLRIREGKRLITDGPFAETREQVGGFYLIEATDLNDAIRVASKMPPARIGSIEIRPLKEINPQ
jgi:hypothetical protein